MTVLLKRHTTHFLFACALFIVMSSVAAFASDTTSFNLLDAGQGGAFNVGDASAEATIELDPALNRDVLEIEATISPSAAAGIWFKDFPAELNAQAADIVEFAARVDDPDISDRISANIELKGDSGIQVIKLPAAVDWLFVQELIDWNKIGDLKEAVIVITQTAGNEPVSAGLYVDLNFKALALSQKIATSIPAKLGSVFLCSLLFAGLAAILRGLFKVSCREVPAERTPVPALCQNVLYGLCAAMIAIIVFHIYSLGVMSFLDVGWNFLFIALAGAATVQLLKFAATGRHLRPSQVFQSAFVVGLLAATSGSIELLAAPSAWVDIIAINKLTAAAACLLYLTANAYLLSTSGSLLRPVSSALLTGTPYLFGWLLTIESPKLLETLGGFITANLFAEHTAILKWLGQVVVIFLFNEAITNGISFVITRRTLRGVKAHLFILFISVFVITSPLIAGLGSGANIAALPAIAIFFVVIITTVFSHAGLWAQVYLLTGMIMDGMHGIEPSWITIRDHTSSGIKKGMVYSGTFMGILYGLKIVSDIPLSQWALSSHSMIALLLFGTLIFPLIKTIIETFDGSHGFFLRASYSYRNITLYARGAVIGLGTAYGFGNGMVDMDMPIRITYGLGVGLLASAGVSIIRDAVFMYRGKGRIQVWRLYFTDAMLGGFIGAAIAFYLDSSQVPVVAEKIRLYTSAGLPTSEYSVYPLINKWGHITLSNVTGGVKLFFNEALAGVINWSVAAWLFAINRAFLTALFQRDKAPIKLLFSKEGFVYLIEHTIQVLRWGLWMSPIINTFLRMMGQATWYNQDGAIRTLVVIYQNVTMGSDQFQAWSLRIFIYVLAYDFFRILIWLDHMGLRIATLVNLSFLGMDRLDEKLARFIGRPSAARCIPEGVKRFMTWAPLLIPFYIPRGKAWGHAWDSSLAISSAKGPPLTSRIMSLPIADKALLAAVTAISCIAIVSIIRWLAGHLSAKKKASYSLSNSKYTVAFKENGHAHSMLIQPGYDITRRSYDTIDPCGRVLYIVDDSMPANDPARFWPVVGNFPQELFAPSTIDRDGVAILINNENNGIKTKIEVSLPDFDTAVEVWTVTLENTPAKERNIKVVPYLEWVLDKPADDRGHTQYSRLFPEMEYSASANAILTWQKKTRSMGILASDIAPEGHLTSRMDFIGRAQSIWSPRVLETLAFTPSCDTEACPTFDPIGSLLIDLSLKPNETRKVRLMIGSAANSRDAIALIENHLKPQRSESEPAPEKADGEPRIGHGEVLPETPKPYSSFTDNGDKLLVRTPFTPRPYDHALSNAAGHYITVTNRGLHTSSNGNSQQNRLTPDWPDTVTREVPSEAFYIYDLDDGDWYSPTYHPLNDSAAKYEAQFGVDGSAVFKMTHKKLSTELTVFVPIDEPVGVYLLTIKNRSQKACKLRLSPYFQMVLSLLPEMAGPLKVSCNRPLNTLFFKNPRNSTSPGSAFVSISEDTEHVETSRGRFFGQGRSLSHPAMVETGRPDSASSDDDRPIAALMTTLDIPANGRQSIVVTLGHTNNKKQAADIIKKYHSVENTRESLEQTRKWWSSLMQTTQVETNDPDFDRLQNWLKYQAVTERIMATRGFYQTSGAFGFRDQLQDTVNLIWADPALARKQIILHASHQFPEGDVTHWFHWLPDGRTGFANRSWASDNLIWLVWGVAEYVRMTGDESILDEMTSYLRSELPLDPLPKGKHGFATFYFRSTQEDSVYDHCIKSIDLVFDKRMGRNGLPLILTGDWNDGLDEIGSEGRGESVWLGFFLYYILDNMLDIIAKREGDLRRDYYLRKMDELKSALEKTWRHDRYLRAIHDDGTEIGIKGSGIWEIDALTAAWAVISGINPQRGRIVFQTAIDELENDVTVLLGTPPLREDTTPYLGRSSHYPEGVRENGMYCHGVQWLIKAGRILAERCHAQDETDKADEYRRTCYRLWRKITPVAHVTPDQIENYGGQPNKQPADMLTTYDNGRMIWNGYTGAAAWLFRQGIEGVIGADLVGNEVILPPDIDVPRGKLKIVSLRRNIENSPLNRTI